MHFSRSCKFLFTLHIKGNLLHDCLLERYSTMFLIAFRKTSRYNSIWGPPFNIEVTLRLKLCLANI